MFERYAWTARGAVALGLAACVLLLADARPGGEASSLQATAPTLGSAASFAVLGGSTVTNTGATTVNGDLGVSPGSAVTGFPPGSVTGGTILAAGAVAAQAQTDTTTAYNSLTNQACDVDLTGQDLNGQTLTPGVYCFQSSAQLTGPLTLDAQGNADAVFVIKIASALTTASGSSVLLINGGSPCNVFWRVGSSATLGTTTSFLGSLLSLTSITLNHGATLSGRALARNGAVTMDDNTISRAACSAADVATTPTTTVTSTPVPTITATAAIPATATVITATAIPATATAIATTAPAVATAVATLPPATQTVVIAATSTANAATTSPTTVAAAPTAEPIHVVTVAALMATPVASSSGLPVQLPSTGDRLPGGVGWGGLLLFGVLLLAGGFGMRRA
jgi:hypothetical protein